MKNLVSAVLAISMALSVGVNCYAASYDPSAIKSTYTLNHDVYTVTGATESNVYAITDEEALTGTKSLRIIHSSGDSADFKLLIKPGGTTLNLGKTDITNWNSANLTGATHTTLAFWAKGEIDTSGIKAMVMVSNGQTFLNSSTWKKGAYPKQDSKGNKWNYYYCEQVVYNVTGQIKDSMNRVYLNFTNDCDIYIDDIAWNYTNDGGVYEWEGNLLKDKDNSFEDTGILLKKESDEKQYARALMYDWVSGAVQLTWLNPASDAISSVKVLDQDGTDITGDVTLDTGSQALNKFDITGLENDKHYTYTVAVTIDNETYNKSIDVLPRADRNYYRFTENGYPILDGKWQPLFGDANADGWKANVAFKYRADEGATNNGCMEIISNNKNRANQFAHLDYAISGLDSNSQYTLSFKGKAFEANDFRIYPDLNKYNTQSFQYKITIGQSGYLVSDNDWKDYEIKLTPKTDATYLRLTILYSVSSLLIDDIKLVKDGTTTNLINNGGFDYEVASASFDSASKTVTWTLPEDNAPWDGYKIYKAGVSEPVAEVSTEDITGNSYVLADAKDDDVYIVKTVFKTAGWASKGVATAAYAITTPVFDEVDFGDNSFSQVGENAEIIWSDIGEGDLTPGTNVMSTISVENITATKPIDIMYLTALFSNDNLEDVVAVSASVKTGESATYKSVISVPDQDGKNYSVKAFVWDGNEFRPIKPVMITNEFTE